MLTIIKFRRLNRIISLISLISLILLGIPVYLLLRNPQTKTEAAWYDEQWTWRQPYTITNNAEVTSQTVTLPNLNTSNLITSGFLQSDCGDSRFTDANGVVLSYTVSSCNGASTSYTVLVNTIFNGSTIIYHYYGNPSAINGFRTTSFSQASCSGCSVVAGTNIQGPGVTAHWKLDEGIGSSAEDASSGNYDGVITEATWKSEDLCVSGKCLELDGSNDVVTVSDAAALDFESYDFTIALWVRVSAADFSASHGLIGKGTDGSTYRYALFYDNNGANKTSSISFRANNGGVNMSTTTSVGIINQWQHIVVSRSGNVFTLYVDGKPKTTQTYSSSLSNDNNNLTLGDDSISTPLNGFLDDIRIYKYARTAAQIGGDFNARGAGAQTGNVIGSTTGNIESLSQGLVGYWKLDETSFSTNCSTRDIADSSGNANSATACPNGAAPTSSTGKFGQAVDFDGTDDYVNAGTESSLDITGGITISMWLNPDSVTSTDNFIMLAEHRINSSGTYNYAIGISGSGAGGTQGRIRASIYDGSNYTDAIGNKSLTTGTWQHITWTYDDTSRIWKTYVNGEFDAQGTWSIPLPTNTSNVLNFGASMDSVSNDYYNGRLDEIRIYKRVLDPSQITSLYNWAPGPFLYYTFDEGSGTSVIDRSGNGYTGSMVGIENPLWVEGKFGKGMRFNSTGQSVTVADADGLSPRTYTVATWFKWDGIRHSVASGLDYAGMVTKGNYDDAEYVFLFHRDSAASDTTITSYLNNSGSARVTWTNSEIDTKWHHIAVTYDLVNMNIYYDGALKASTALSTAITAGAHDLRVGNVSSEMYPWGGDLDEVKIYSYARTPKQIIEDMNAGHPAGGSPVGSQTIFWALDEGQGSTISNQSTQQQSLTGTATGTVWIPSQRCIINQCLEFDTTTDNIAGGSPTFLDSATAMSVSFWLNPQSLAVDRSIVSKHDAASNAFAIRTDATNSDELRIQIANGAADTSNFVTTTNADLAVGSWSHIAVVYDGTLPASQRVSVFKNGKPVAGAITGAIPTTIRTSTAALRVGQAAATYSSILGVIDEVKIYSGALTQSEIAIDANAGSSLSSGGVLGEKTNEYSDVMYDPIGYFKLDETSGTTAADSSPAQNTGTITGSPSSVAGQRGNALDLNGTNQTVGIPASNSFVFPRNVTVSAWINLDVNNVTQNIVQRGSSSGFAFYINASGRLAYTMQGGATVQSTTTTLSTGTWYHVVVTKSDTTVTLYINGQYEFSGASGGNIVQDTRSMYIGSSQGTSDFLNGRVDDVRLYNVALNHGEVNVLYNGAGPVGHWKLDEKSGTSLVDSSGNGNTGTLIGSPASYPGKVGSSFRFNGHSQNATVANHSSLNPARDASWEAWIKLERNTGANQNIIQKGSSSGWAFFVNPSGQLSLNVFGAANTTGSTVLQIGRWYHVAATKSGANGVLYIDGQVETTSSSLPATITTDSQTLYIASSNGSIDFFHGQLDEVKLYNYTRNARQIAYSFNRGAPKSWWQFDECQGSTAYDAALRGDGQSRGKTGTLTPQALGNTAVGSCGSGTSTHMWNDGTTGKYNSALGLDGTDDYVTVASPELPTGDFTYAAWVYVQDTNNNGMFMAADGAGNQELFIRVDGPGMTVNVSLNGTGDDIVSSGAVSLNTWTHIVVTRYSGALNIYLNGMRDPSFGADTATLGFGSCELLIGVDSDSACAGTLNDFLNGMIDEAQIYQYALSASQVKQLFNQGSGTRFGPSTGSS